MRKSAAIFSKLKYLGLLGLPMFISNAAIWRWFWLFWLLGLLEIALTLPTFIQSIQQIAGMVVTAFKYNPTPDKDNYVPNVLYSLPFAGKWVAVNGGVTKGNSHSWGIQTQRYAYDFIMLDEEGKSFSGSGASVADYYCYGKELLVPADGVVVEVGNRCKDSQIMAGGQTDPLIKDIRGNYVVLQHTENEFSVLAHLMPDSILVRKGERVKRKQPLARCGNSGNTSEPHLHFQVQNGRSFFASAGLPIHFGGIETSACPGYAAYDKRPVVIEAETGSSFVSRGQSVWNA